jgi:hypothetical protein
VPPFALRTASRDGRSSVSGLRSMTRPVPGGTDD